MKIQNINVKGNIMNFELSKSSTAFANALRRVMMSEVPVMAIDEIDFYENSTSLYDEFIAHRIGLIPLTTDLKTYKVADECCGGKCSKCSAILSLESTGPTVVYSGDLKSSDKKIEPAEDKIIITKLAEDQKLRLEGKAVLGKGLKHAKFQACLATYKQKKTKPDEFTFDVESYGSLSPKELLQEAVNILADKTVELEKLLK